MEPIRSVSQQADRRRNKASSLRAQAQQLNERADRLERNAEHWERGAAGEAAVGAALDSLRTHGFVVLHDRKWPGRQRANIDHVAVGPGGILVVDAKNWTGSVSIRDGVVRQNGFRRGRQIDGAKDAAQAVSGLLDLPWALHVIPVIALAGAAPRGVHRSGEVQVVGAGDLVGWATALPAHLAPADVIGIAQHLERLLPLATSPMPRQRRISTRTTVREPSARQRRRQARRRAAAREALFKMVALVVVALAAPTAFAWWAQHGTGVVEAAVPSFPTPTVSTSASAQPRVFSGCRELRATYPRGVRRPGAHNAGRQVWKGVQTDLAAYRANRKLDTDHDGIACEQARRMNR